MSRPKRVLKEFSELPAPVQERIGLVISGIMQVAFKGQALTDWEPRAGTQMHRIWKMNKLDERQQIAWRTLLDDFDTAQGCSGKVTGSYGDYTDKGSSGELKIPTAYVNAQYKRLEALQCFLDRSERALLSELVQDTYHGKSSLQLEQIGVIRSGYGEKDAARVAGVVHVQTLLTRVASFYGI